MRLVQITQTTANGCHKVLVSCKARHGKGRYNSAPLSSTGVGSKSTSDGREMLQKNAIWSDVDISRVLACLLGSLPRLTWLLLPLIATWLQRDTNALSSLEHCSEVIRACFVCPAQFGHATRGG